MARPKPAPKLKAIKPAEAVAFIGGGKTARQQGTKTLKKATFYFPPDLHRRAKAWAAEHEMTLSEMAVQGLEMVMKERG